MQANSNLVAPIPGVQKPRTPHSTPVDSGDVPSRKPRRLAWHRQAVLKLRRAYLLRLSLLYTCLRETRTLPNRIRFVCKHRPDLHGVDLGEFFQRTCGENYEVNKQTLACSADIERLRAARPELTSVDLALATEAWSMGVEWCVCKHNQLSVHT
jgi:hypothetical protein